MTPIPGRKNAANGAVGGRAKNAIRPYGPDPIQPDLSQNAGIAPGALVQTLHGERLIETLSVGDRVKSSCGRYVALSAITRSVAPTQNLCRVSPSALPDNRPATRDPLIASASQHVWISGWLARAMFKRQDALVPLSALMDQELIAPIRQRTELPLFQLHTEDTALIMIAGLRLLTTPNWAMTPATTP